MDEPQTPPSDESQQPVPATPPAPPEQAIASTAAPETPTTDAGLLRAFTQSQQRLSAVASALGISKTSTPEQFVAAITARRQAIATADADLEQDPRLAAQAASLRAREESIARRQYGAAADLTATILESLRSGSASFLELTEIVDQHVIEAAASRFTGATPAQAGGSPAPAAPPAPSGQQARAPERPQVMEELRGNAGMFDPGITREQAGSPAGFFKQLQERIPGFPR